MLFDWFTLVAQIINFLILAWLLKRFLYKPVLQAIDKREMHIAAQINEAESKKTEAIKELESLKVKNAGLEQQRQELLGKAISEANAEHLRLLEESRKEVEDLRLRLHESLKNEHENLKEEIMQRTQKEVFAIARKTLNDLASSNLEEQIVQVFIGRLNQLNPEDLALLVSAIKSSHFKVLIRSSNNIASELQNNIKETLANITHTNIDLKFETAPHLISGIEMISGGYKMVWSIEEYLGSLQESLAELLKDKNL
jgi:F-type H+-transporting ATPase subunit b